MKRTHTLLAALLLGLALILAGCGSDSGSDGGVASASKDSSDSKDSKETPTEDREAQGLKFAQCMREHGVDMPDPKNGRFTMKGGPGDQEKIQTAQEACQQYLPQMDAGQAKERNAKALEFAQCMRKHGVEAFKDPKNGGMMLDQKIAEDPDFEAAQEACQDIMGGNLSMNKGDGA